jgi:hypothetical protein
LELVIIGSGLDTDSYPSTLIFITQISWCSKYNLIVVRSGRHFPLFSNNFHIWGKKKNVTDYTWPFGGPGLLILFENQVLTYLES